MFNKRIRGISGIWGNKHEAMYHVYTGYKRQFLGGGYYYVVVENDRNRQEERFASEYEADEAAEEYAVEISRGNLQI